MRKYLFFSFLGLLILVMFSCGKGEVESKRWDEVMKNHDVVMPLMGNINKVRKDLKTYVAEQDSLPAEQQQSVNQLLVKLDNADEAMMDWMNGFQQLERLRNEKSHEEIMKYLDEQEKAIEVVGKEMKESIQSGLQFLKSKE